MSPFTTTLKYDLHLKHEDQSAGKDDGELTVRFYCGAGSRIIDATMVDCSTPDLFALFQATADGS